MELFYFTEENILEGPPILYEPSGGGLGYEIFQALNRNRGKVAQYIIETGEVDKYEELLERSVKIAIFLKKKQLKNDDVVCLCSGNHLNSLVPFVASQFIGTTYASLDPTLPEKDLLYFLDYLEPKVLFTTDEIAEKLENLSWKTRADCDVVKFSEFPEMLLENVEMSDFRPVFIENLGETAVIFLTSGTTGKPKGICCSHYVMVANTFNGFHHSICRGKFNLNNFSYEYNNRENMKIMFFSAMYWVTGVKISLNVFFTGSSRVIGSLYNAEKTWKAIEKYQPDTLFLPPGQSNELCFYAENKGINESVDFFITGGSSVTHSHLENIRKIFPKATILQGYGQTENYGLITCFKPDNEEDLRLNARYPLSCGKVIAGIQLKIVDLDTERSCKANQQGEIRIKNKFMMTGYYKMDSSSAFDSRGWFKTGDLGFFNENNCVFIVDRVKDIIRYILYDIRPSVIEAVLLRHPAVLECFVFGFPHPKDEEHPMGVVVLKDDYKGKVDGEEIVKFVNENVPSERYIVRGGVKIVEEMLKTATGKIRKIEMKNRIIDGIL